jgi:hypothetical protein
MLDNVKTTEETLELTVTTKGSRLAGLARIASSCSCSCSCCVTIQVSAS